MASSALDKWKERTRQAQKPAETKLSAWEKRVTQAQKENNAQKAQEKAQQTALTRANENAERVLPKNDPLTVSAVKNAARYTNKKNDEPVPTVELTNPRATTAAQRKTEKDPISDRAKKTAEIRKDIDTTSTQSRVGKGAQSVLLSPYAQTEYLLETAKTANRPSWQTDDYAAAVSEFNRVRRLYPEGSTEYQTALQKLQEAQHVVNDYTGELVDKDSRPARFMAGVKQLEQEALEGTSGIGRFLGETAITMGDTLARLPLNAILPGSGKAMAGIAAAAEKAYELNERGTGAKEALGRGLVSGAIEAGTEAASLDNLLDIVKTGGKTGLWNIVKQAATEAGEEGISYILNYGADKVAGDPEAEFIWNDFWKSMGMGALSGGIMGGGATAVNRANAAAVGKTYQDVAPELIAEGLELGQDTEAFRTATEMQRKLDAGKPLSNVDVGRMVQDNEAAASPLNQIALEMAEEEIRAREQAQQAAVAANEVQQVQTPVRAEMPVQEAVQAQEAQRAQGMPLPGKRQMQPLENRRQAQYTETRKNTEGGVNGGEEVYLRTGSQRYDGADPGRQVRQLEESAGRDPGRQDTGLRPKDGGAAALRSGKQVTTSALGITGGAVNDSIRIVTGGETEATKAAKTLAKERGLRLTLFTGGNLTINGEECRAYITGDRAFVRADHSDFDADQLMRHEAGHDQIAKGEIDIKAATETIRKRLGGRNNVQRAAQTYASAFAGIDMTVEEAIEEIICDSLGDMNVFSDTAAETAFGEVLEITRKAVSENSVESKTGPPVEGKASREYWRTDLNKQQFQELMKVVQQDVKTSQNNITDNANWLFTSVGNAPVLSIYSTLDQNEPTVLYEVKGAQAEFEKNILKNILEGIKNAKSADRKSNVIDRVLGRGWVRGSGSDINGSGSAGQGGNAGNAGVLRQQPQRHTSAAFESVLRNLFQTQETESVSEDLAALGVETDGESAGKASRETSREDVLKAVEKLLEEAEEKLDEQELTDEMYYGRKLAEQKARDKEKLERLRERKNERIAQVKAGSRDAVKTARIEERLKRDEKIAQLKEEQRQKLEDTVTAERMAAGRELAEQKAHDKARRENASESRKAAKLRSQINRHVNSMQQMLLRPSDKRHVPEHLRKATANVLSAINMESGYDLSFGADAKYHRVKPGTDPHAELTKRTQAFRELRKAYTAIVQNAEEEALIIDPDLMGDSATGAPGLFDQLMDLDSKRLVDMNSAELEVVWKVLRSVEHSISNAGKLLSKSKYESTKAHAEAFAADAAKRTDAKSILRKKISLDLEDPYTFFSHYGESGKAIYRMLRDAQDSAAVKVDTIAKKVQEIVDPKTVENIQKERHEFTTETGDRLTLTTGQLMSLYNLMGRRQAHDHLMKGGILQPEIKRSGKQKRIDRGNEMVRLSAEDLNGLAAMLTDEQKNIAVALQKIMTEDLAAWGNEASMKAYGYQKFTGEDYWPIKSAAEGLTSTVEKNSGQARSIKNIGMAKNTVPHASNALEIGDVFDVFAQHTADMVDYSSWLLPMEDINRLYNWKYRDQMGNKTGKTVKGILEAKGGAGSNKYWTNLMEDIQNGIAVKQDTNVEGLINRLIGNAKGASVGANMRVVVQQPTAYLRAAAIFSPDSLAKGMAKGVTSGNGWKKATKWAPIAHIKDVGGFDQGSAKTISQQMYGTKTKLESFNEKFSWAAAKADAITWGRLWNAAEWETKKRFSDLEPGSDAFYKKTAELFTDMVDQSQVVDGILQRSQLMRSGNAINKQAAAFMGEPTKTLNMMLREVDAWKHSSGKARSDARRRVGRTAIALGVTAGINALAQAIVDAMRDDDKEKEYLERVWSAFSGIEGDEETGADIAKNIVLKGNLAGNVNPVSMVPYGSDLMSIFQGYDVTRADADVIAAVVADYNLFTKSMSGEGSKTPLYAAKRLIASIGKMFGVSAVNLGRDIWATIGTVARSMEDYQLLYEMDRMVYTLENNKKKFINTLYLAEKAGDEKAAEHIRGDLLANGIDEEKIEEYFTKFRKAEESYVAVENEVGERVSSAVAESAIYQRATDAQREKADEMVTQWARYQAMLGEEPDYAPPQAQKWMLTAENGAEVGLTETEFILYRLAAEMADEDGNGKIKQQEFLDAANNFGLTNRELAYLWEEDRGWSEKTNPYK